MTRTRGQAKMLAEGNKASETTTKSNKKQSPTKSFSLVVERLDPSQFSTYEDHIEVESKKQIKSVKNVKESAGTRRTMRGKENRIGENTETIKPKVIQIKDDEPVKKATRATKAKKAPEEVKEAVAGNSQEPKERSKRRERGEQKKEDSEEEKGYEGEVEMKNLVIRVRKMSSATIKNKISQNNQEATSKPARRVLSTRNQVKNVDEETGKEGQSSSDKVVENPAKKTRAVSKAKEPPAAKEVQPTVKKVSAAEKKKENEKPSISRGRTQPATKKPDPPQNSKSHTRSRARSVINDDDKLNGTLTPTIRVRAVDVASIGQKVEAEPETNKVKQKQKKQAVVKDSAGTSSKIADAPKRTTRGSTKPAVAQPEALFKTKRKAAKKVEQVVVIEDESVEGIDPVVESVEEALEPETPEDLRKVPEPAKRPKRGNKQEKIEFKKLALISAVAKAPAPVLSASSFKSPLPPATKIIDTLDDPAEDPYNFTASQSEGPKNLKKKKVTNNKKRPQAKPGSTMELLMHKETLDAALYSMNAQNNPVLYKKEVIQVEKKINVPAPSISKFVILDNEKVSNTAPSGSFAIARKSYATVTKEPQIIASTSAPLPQPSTSGVVAAKPFSSTPNVFRQSFAPNIHSKVWHSPPAVSRRTVLPNDETVSIPTFISNSPPIQSTFALKMAAQRTNASATTPFRVPGSNLPTAFYMGLSKNDGTPTFSSDLMETKRAEEVEERSEGNSKSKSCNYPENDENQPENDQENDENQAANLTKTSSAESRDRTILGHSNAENVEPSGFMRSPVKKRRLNQGIRSPLKALAIPKLPEGDVSSISVFNTTMEQSIPVKRVEVVEAEEDESLDIDNLCNQAEKDEESHDTFGFDELIEADRHVPGPSGALVNTSDDIKDKLKSMKKYLPSKNNQGRDKHIFPTTPLKRIDAFKEHNEAAQMNIQKFMTASTPMVKTQKSSKSSFGNVSAINERKKNENSVETDDESNIELFGDQSELFNLQRSYTRRKRIPEFLRRVEVGDHESDSDGEEMRGPPKTKKKKPNVEQTAEFKKFVHEKSSEFAEVDDYEMVIEKK